MKAIDSGERGSAGGPGAALGNRMAMGGGGNIAPSVPAVTAMPTAAATVTSGLLKLDGARGVVDERRTRFRRVARSTSR